MTKESEKGGFILAFSPFSQSMETTMPLDNACNRLPAINALPSCCCGSTFIDCFLATAYVVITHMLIELAVRPMPL